MRIYITEWKNRFRMGKVLWFDEWFFRIFEIKKHLLDLSRQGDDYKQMSRETKEKETKNNWNRRREIKRSARLWSTNLVARSREAAASRAFRIESRNSRTPACIFHCESNSLSLPTLVTSRYRKREPESIRADQTIDKLTLFKPSMPVVRLSRPIV